MSSRVKHILLATNGLQSSQTTHETALQFAKRFGAKVTLVDTVEPPSTLTRWISSSANDVFEMVLADKQARLEKIAADFHKENIDAEVKVLFGKSSVAITREVIEQDVDLVVRYRKGANSTQPGPVGNTARALMRVCPCPILLVGDEVISTPNILASIDAEHAKHENQSIVTAAIQFAQDNDHLHGVYCWEMYGADMLMDRMAPDVFKATETQTREMYEKIFEKFRQANELGELNERFEIQNGHPSQVIPQLCEAQGINLVVLCSASLNHPLKRLIGSTIEPLLSSIPCALLVVKPIGFESSVKATRTTQEATSAGS